MLHFHNTYTNGVETAAAGSRGIVKLNGGGILA